MADPGVHPAAVPHGLQPVFWDKEQNELFTESSALVNPRRHIAPTLRTIARAGSLAGSNWVLSPDSARADVTAHVWDMGCWSEALGIFCWISSTATMVSADGYNWTVDPLPAELAGLAWNSICWSPELGIFLMVNNYTADATKPTVAWSKNGRSWVSSGAWPRAWRGVIWVSELGLFVATGGSTPDAMYSRDGRTWLEGDAPAGTWRRISWSPQLKLMVTTEESAGKEIWSEDGIKWEYSKNAPITGTYIDQVWADALGMFVALNRSATLLDHVGKTSTDGKTWTSAPTPGLKGIGVCWLPQRKLLVSGISTGTQRLATSTDGFTWTPITAPTGFTIPTYFCWSPRLGRLVSVAGGGAQRIVVS